VLQPAQTALFASSFEFPDANSPNRSCNAQHTPIIYIFEAEEHKVKTGQLHFPQSTLCPQQDLQIKRTHANARHACGPRVRSRASGRVTIALLLRHCCRDAAPMRGNNNATAAPSRSLITRRRVTHDAVCSLGVF
jgi:hypothetical protein